MPRVPTAAPLDMGTVCSCFGVGITTPLLSFLRGAGIVPNIAMNAGVPAAAPITLLQLLGAGKALTGTAPAISIQRPTAGTLSANSPVTPSEGSGSYSYSTTWASGGSGITITNETSANPGVTSTYSGASLSRDGVLRTTINDGYMTYNVDRNVSLTWGSA